MRAVWKFPLAMTTAQQIIEMPAQSDIKHVRDQTIAGQQYVVMWAEVDPHRSNLERAFRLFATGDEIDLPMYQYVGTVHIDWTVWHVYELRP